MEGKKISFGFKKVKKAEKPVVEEQKDFIECVEEKAIKVVGGEKVEKKEPLVIPMKPNTLITAEKLKEIAAKVENSLEEPMEQKDTEVNIKIEPVEGETLDQMAVRELLQEAKKEVKVETQALTVPIPAKPVMDGQKESTLDDYDAVPIQDFGLAMLRGMGWTPDQEKANKYKQPQLRPKGLGLGADKIISDKQKKKTANKDGNEEELAIVKNSYVKIVAGKHSGYYGKVVSLDEENGRVMVEITVKKETVSLSEFMMQPVTKAEFDKESKVINMDAYEEYKKRDLSQNKKSSHKFPLDNNISRKDSPKGNDKEASSSTQNDESKERENRRRDKSSNGRDRRQDRRDSSSSEDRSKKRDKYKRDSSSAEKDNRKTERARQELSEENLRKTEKSRRNSSEDRNKRRKDRSQRNTPEERSRRRNKDKAKRDSSESEDRGSKKYKEKYKRDKSKERDSMKQKEKSRRDSSDEDRSREKKERVRKRYSSNDSLSSLSDSDKKKKLKNCRRQKDSSDTESDPPKKDKRDIDKKRKGKKKKRDRDRSPNYKKHRK